MSKDGGRAAKAIAGEVFKNFTDSGMILPELSISAEPELWDRVTPTRIIMTAVQVILRTRWDDGISSDEMLLGPILPLSRKDLLTLVEASLGDVSAANRAKSEGLFSLLNSVRLLSALVNEESISDEGLERLFCMADQICRESLGGVVLRRGEECGPWDASEDSAPRIELVDLGGIRIPALRDMDIQPMGSGTDTVAVTLVKDGAAIQLQAFIATTGEPWDIARFDMMNKMRAQGGVVKEWGGRAGLEIRAVVPVETGSGQSVTRNVRIIGCDGPGWLLRGVISGSGAEPESRDEWPYDIFLGTVVVGAYPVCAHGDVISLCLRVPGVAQED